MSVTTETSQLPLGDASLSNHDLAPVPAERRTWNTWNFLALWVGMCVCIPSYMIASSMIEGGMSAMQAILTVFVGNVIVLVPMILNGHVGVQYGIPFPVYSRISFGVLGANIPALLRAVVACGWFGIQTWLGGVALFHILEVFWPGATSFPYTMPAFMGVDLIPFLCFFAFWGLNVFIIFKGIESIKHLESFCAPLLILSGLALLWWAYTEANGFGGLFEAPSKFKTDREFWAFFVPSLTAMVSFWATISLNIPDFTRYAKSQKAQILGQTLGLPTTMTLIAFIGVAVTGASVIIYGEALWDPLALIGRFENPVVVVVSMAAIAMATLAMNVAANVVAPANDLANLAPSKIDFKRGGLITALIGLIIQPWKILADPSNYIITWLVGYSALLGPIAGILLTDYFIIRRCRVAVSELYQRQGRYTYKNGYNPAAIIALMAGILPNVPGFLIQIQLVPPDTFPTIMTDLYHFAWFIGLAVSSLCYYALMRTHQDHAPISSDKEVTHVPHSHAE
jgi:NCS1 family nucleobase:cation symporter-1